MAMQGNKSETRTLTPSQLVAWSEDNTQIMRLKSGRDLLPGGYLASFAPVLVDWQASDLSGDSPFLILRNVNYGGNPLERSVVMQSVRAPLDGITSAEFTLVSSRLVGLLSPFQHAQLRFVFDPDNQPKLLNLADAGTGTDAALPDLILSWQSWRPKMAQFSHRRGLDIDSYSLTQRVFAGPQLFLEDTLRGKDWFSYPLRLPGGRAGLSELFMVGLGLGDGAARNTLSGLLEKAEGEWLKHAPQDNTSTEQLRRDWQMLHQRLQEDEAPEEELARMPDNEDGYQLLVRSCATLARYTVLTAAARLLDRGFDDEVVRKALPSYELASPESWMKEIAHADLSGVFLRAPMAVSFLLRHPESNPRRIPQELADAGLLETENGKPQFTNYSGTGVSPYGHAQPG